MLRKLYSYIAIAKYDIEGFSLWYTLGLYKV